MKVKKFLLIVTIILTLFLMVSCQKEKGKITLEVIDQDGSSLYSEVVSFTEEDTLKLLITKDKKINAQGENGQYGYYILKLCDVEAVGKTYWAFYVDDEYSLVGIDSHSLKDGQKITFKLEAYE